MSIELDEVVKTAKDNWRKLRESPEGREPLPDWSELPPHVHARMIDAAAEVMCMEYSTFQNSAFSLQPSAL